MRYIFKGVRHGFPATPGNYMTNRIRAHSPKEALKKAYIEAERLHFELKPNPKTGELIWDQKEVKPRKPKRKPKHIIPVPELNMHQFNDIVRQIETAYRNDNKCWGRREGTINADTVRKTIRKHKIGPVLCRYCLVDFRGRYCSPEHSYYYRSIMDNFYGPQWPWAEAPKNGDSIDHIKPISMGGLEFDRDNLQWMDLTENIRKGGINRIRERQRMELKAQIILAQAQALELWSFLGHGQNKLMKSSPSPSPPKRVRG